MFLFENANCVLVVMCGWQVAKIARMIYFVAFHCFLMILPSIISFHIPPPQVGLWIVGSGTLGELIAKEWSQEYPSDVIVAETRTTERHSQLSSLGRNIVPILREKRWENYPKHCAKNVVICLPPSTASSHSKEISDKSSDLYLDEIKEALNLFHDGSKRDGMCLLISTTGVYGDGNNRVVTEFSSVDQNPTNTRAARGLAAEEIILQSNLNNKKSVLRLAGLYSLTRGPHMYWLKQFQSEPPITSSEPESLVNLISYEDAARAAVKVLQNGHDKEIYLASDNEPLTRSEILHAIFQQDNDELEQVPIDSSSSLRQGKRCNSSWTRTRIGWTPRYPSFRKYFHSLRAKGLS